MVSQYQIERSSFILFWQWYYGYALKNVFVVYGDYVRWALHKFSISKHLRTLFFPFHRDIVKKGRGFNFKDFFSVLGLNLISRVIGFILRLITILIGLLIALVIVVSGFVIILVYITLPALIIFGIIIQFK